MDANPLADPYFHPTAIVEPGASIGLGSKVWHFSHIMPQAVLGLKCNIGQNVFIANKVILGNGVKVQNNVSLYEGLIVEDDVFLGPSAVFTNVINPRAFVERKDQYKPTRICLGASIGANATIVCGVTIGRYAFVGAGALVTKDVKDFELVFGQPATHRGWMSQLGHKLQFDTQGHATCPESGASYFLDSQSNTVSILP